MTTEQAAAVARVREAVAQANLCMPHLSTVIVATDDAAAILAALDAAQYSLKNAHLMIEVDGTTIEAQASRIAVLEAAQAAAQAPRTLLEQYDLDQSPEYRKGYEDGRLKGYEVGHRHAQAAAQAPRDVPSREVDEAALARLRERGAVAWSDVPDASAWVDEQRGASV